MDYNELEPNNQDEQLQVLTNYYKEAEFQGIFDLNLINAGMGSGKTRLMQNINIAEINYVIAPDATLMNQLFTDFDSSCLKDCVLIRGDDTRVKQKIEVNVRKNRVIVFFSNLASTGSAFGPSAKRLKVLIEMFKSYKQLALIDEIDQQLTYLTGGLNAKLDHSKTIMDACDRVLSQSNYSLNIFDILRANAVKCMGFSGTMNNMICSKLPSLGYSNNQISIMNVAPIEYLYKDLKIIPMGMSSFKTMMPYLDELEKMPPNKMGLMGFASEKEIEEFIDWYRETYARELPYVKITSAANSDDLSSTKGIDKLRGARYVIGINMVITGFNLSTYIKDREFALTSLYRNMSDKISQPLSKNPEHILHNEVAATMRQFIARARKGGICLVPQAYYKIGTLYENLQEVFNTICEGHNEFLWVGPPRTSQVERNAQCLVLALKQNLKKDSSDRPVVAEILDDLKNLFDNRDFRAECNMDVVDPYWIDCIELLWNIYAERYRHGMTNEEFNKSKKDMITKAKSSRGPIGQRGNGFRDGREVNTDIMKEVRNRSKEICAHCSEPIDEDQEPQISHIIRNDCSGKYTLDNLVFSHKGCDALYDNEHRFIHDPLGGVFLAKKYNNHTSDMNQWNCISNSNILGRWNWVMEQMHLTEEKFRQTLFDKGYTFHELSGTPSLIPSSIAQGSKRP